MSTDFLCYLSRMIEPWEVASTGHDVQLCVQILMGAGWNLSRGHGAQMERVRQLLHQPVELLTDAGDDRHLSEVYSYLTVLENDPDHARRALEAGERSGDPTATARPHHYLGIQMFLAGNYEDALLHFREAMKGLRSAHLTAFTTVWAASTLARMGKTDEAIDLAEAALDVFMEIADTGGQETAFQTICSIQLGLGRADDALESMERRIELWLFEAADPGGHAIAAHAAARADRFDRSLAHLELITDEVPADLLHEDSLDHALLATTHLGVAHEDPEIAALALAAESTYRLHTPGPSRRPSGREYGSSRRTGARPSRPPRLRVHHPGS